jgi:hypothetical protein
MPSHISGPLTQEHAETLIDDKGTLDVIVDMPLRDLLDLVPETTIDELVAKDFFMADARVGVSDCATSTIPVRVTGSVSFYTES